MTPSALTLRTLLCLTFLASIGCSSAPTPQPPTSTQPSIQPAAQSAADSTTPQTQSAMPAATAPGKPYDFYLLTLSWSPEYCLTNPSSPECPQHLGFVVHGLWPQNNNGTYPENCALRPGPTSPSVWAGLMPTAALAQHEWQTHGTCTPYDADTYFGLVRKAFGEVKIPPAFASTTKQTMQPPAAIITEFAQANPTFPTGSIALSCGNNQLTAMEFCLDKSLNAIACSDVKSCKGNVVKIPPQNAAH